MLTTELKKNDPVLAKEFFEQKIMFTTGPHELSKKLEEKADIAVIDVRAPEDYRSGHIPGAVNLPKDKWNTREGLDKNKLNVLYCYSQTCHLAARAAAEFADHGYSVMELEGGFDVWKKNNLKEEK